jgi:hypothetical protein
MSNNVSVSITADVADLQVKRAVMSAELRAATADLSNFAKTARTGGMTDALRADMLRAAEAATTAKGRIAALDVEMRQLRADSAGASIFAGLGKDLQSLEGAGKAIGGLRASVAGIGEALLGAFAVGALAEWAKKMGEAGEKTQHTAQILGTSVGTVQQLTGAFTLMGVDADRGVLGIERLDKAFAKARQGSKEQAAVFRELGVSTAHDYQQMQLLGAVMDGFAKEADGPAKVAQAMQLFGRTGAALIPFLDLGKKGLEELNRVTAQYGIKNEDAAAKSAQLGSAFNENKVAMSGLGNVMAQSLAPAFTIVVQGVNQLISSWVKSYQQGGAVKTVVEWLAGAFKALVTVVVVLGTAFDVTFKLIGAVVSTFRSDWAAIVADVKGGARELGDAFEGLGHVIYDALTHNIWAAASDMKRAEQKMVSDAKEAAAQVAGDLAASGAAFAKGAGSAAQDSAGSQDWLSKLWTGKPHKQMDTTGEGGGDTSGDAAKGGRAKKGKDDQVQVWEEQLQTQLEDEKNFFADSKTEELAFWQAKLAMTAAGSKDQREVKTKIYELEKSMAQEAEAATLASYDAQIEAARGNWSKQSALEGQKLAEIRSKYGEQSREYQEALKAQETMLREHNREVAGLQVEQSQSALRIAQAGVEAEKLIELSKLETQREVIEERDKMGGGSIGFGDITKLADIKRQELAVEDRAFEQSYQAELSSLQARLAIKNLEPQQVQKIQDQIAQTMAEHSQQELARAQQDAQKMQAIQAQEAEAIQQKWLSAIQPIGNAFDQMFALMFQRGQNFGQGMIRIGEGMLESFVSVLTRMAEKWIVTHVIMAAVAKLTGGSAAATAESGVQAQAALAGAGGTASMAAAPFPFDTAAPAFGQAMYALAMSFSAAKGFDVPSGLNPMTQLHAREMVLPAPIADHVRDSMGAGAGAGAGARAGQTINNHFSPTIHAPASARLEDMLASEGHVMLAWMRRAARDGKLARA